jgi:hypothetical protein
MHPSGTGTAASSSAVWQFAVANPMASSAHLNVLCLATIQNGSSHQSMFIGYGMATCLPN